MAGSRSTNTMAEFLQRMVGDIADAKVLPDADLEFLIQLETTILQKLRAPIDALMGQMQTNPMAQNPMSGSPAGMAQGAMSGGQPPTPPAQQRVAGIRMDPNMPNPDELRRMISS